jgi:hypothetical protein
MDWLEIVEGGEFVQVHLFILALANLQPTEIETIAIMKA